MLIVGFTICDELSKGEVQWCLRMQNLLRVVFLYHASSFRLRMTLNTKQTKTCKFIRWKDINLFFHLLLTMSLSPTVGVFSIHTTYASWLSYDE